MTPAGYHGSRFVADERRTVLWQSLWRYRFSAMVGPEDCVLDLGAGHCSFINAVVARRRIAIDTWEGFTAYAAPGVEWRICGAAELDFLQDASVDFALASNLFEHLTREEFLQVLTTLYKKLSERGILAIVQPNYYYAFREYFDDFDHKSIYTHISLPDYLTANSFDVFLVEPRFMPLSVRGHLPVKPFLIRAWLASPIKPAGKQMLVCARPRR